MAMWLLWILSLAASFLLPATGEVVESFQTCSEFFLDGKPPNLESPQWARICQRYKNKYHFATMYDKIARIPMFSAYKYKPGKGERLEEWMIEPQLALPKDQNRKSMEEDSSWKIHRNELEESQAVERDYEDGILYDKGHLAPYSHQPDQDSKDATFTLTNIVPQLRELNRGEWAEYEKNVTAKDCEDLYIIVGAAPGNTNISDRVNVPSYIWAAGCCVLQNSKRSWAVIGNNNQKNYNNRKKPRHNPNYYKRVKRLTLGELQDELTKLYNYNNNIDLFNNACNVPQNLSHQANESQVQA